jgi:dihydrolipoamide dehydrogenase
MALPTTTRCEVAGTGGHGVRVWAAGDVTGTTFAHASRYQAGVVAANILGQHGEADYSAIPRCVFTTPSVFAVGAVPGATAGDAEPAAASVASPDHGPGNGARVRRMLRIARVSPERAPAAGPAPGAQGGASPPDAAPDVRLLTARVRLSDTTRGQLGQDDLGCIELYADAGTGVLAGAVAVGPDAASWMGEVTLAIRAKVPVAVLADVVHAFPTYGEALETALRELAGTGDSAADADQPEEEGTGTLSELDMETPEDDAIEQHQEVVPDEAVASARREVPFDVNEADAAEQERAVGFDDDDYR